ncbi:metallophosphoesterase [uncultured Anaerococcus sp.]|uniref:metallophosphoesterase family protein n=1 Tax=uncultured Anaerococcus sp. TaxID=293428 RepID=UPI00260E585A|nr:metallophosphoesterase [uncultured Anaerococcus sp.]
MNLQKINQFDISIISDPHVLSYDLISNTTDFQKEIKIDRKLLVESEALLGEALSMVSDAGSKFLFLPGDLVKDGEYKSHEIVKKYIIDWKNAKEGRDIFMIPGNHDINNHKSYDFKKDDFTKNINPKEFYDLYSFIYENPYVLEMYKDSTIFLNYLDRVNKEFNREEKFQYYAHGYFSYVSRIPSKENDSGLTIIALDTSIYSADTEQNHKDDRENIPGSVTLEQMRWTVEKIEEAKARKDLIFVMAHHALVPNFRNQELVFSPFIIKEWRNKFIDDDPRINNKTPIEVLADNGVKFVFTGHLHENGTAKYISEMGNVIYDVQTGSTVTYPLPIRHVKLINKVEKENAYEVYIKTELIKKFTYRNLADEIEVVDDAVNYTINKQLSLRDVLHNYIRIQANNPKFSHIDIQKEANKLASSYLGRDIPIHGYMNQIVFPMIENKFPVIKRYIGKIDVVKKNGEYEFKVRAIKNTLHIKASNIEAAIDIILKQIEDKVLIPYNVVKHWDQIINKAWQMPIDEYGHTFYDFANYIYQYKPLGEEERPEYVSKMIDNLNNPNYNIIDIVLDYVADEINEAFDKFTSSILLEKDGSKEKFFDDLVQTKGLTSNLAYKYMKRRVNNLRDLLDFFSRYLTKKKDLTGVDLAKRIVKTRTVRNAKETFSDKMFGQTSLRRFVIDVVNSMNEEMVEIYQNEDLNELERYFNYIEYDDTNV